MSLEDDDIKPPSGFYDMLPIGVAALLTACAIGLCFFTFTVKGEKPAAQPTEVTIGVGQGSTIQPQNPQK
jgi:hypothetical protein